MNSGRGIKYFDDDAFAKLRHGNRVSAWLQSSSQRQLPQVPEHFCLATTERAASDILIGQDRGVAMGTALTDQTDANELWGG